MKSVLVYILCVLFTILLLGGIFAAVLFPEKLPDWMGWIVGVELYFVFMIVLNRLQFWILKVLGIKQHEL